MAKEPGQPSPEPKPPSFAELPPPQSVDMPAYTTQMIFEMNGTLGRVEQALSGLEKRLDTVRADLKSDLDGLDERFSSIENHWHWIAGGIAVAVLLIPFCGWLLWISLQDKIEAILQIIRKA